ncbi:MAG: hypothetical protein H0X66_20205 [Verrucomicrobia bacterium]|nr:hypothetical protein [Verrucomicrobiota bacterium]
MKTLVRLLPLFRAKGSISSLCFVFTRSSKPSVETTQFVFGKVGQSCRSALTSVFVLDLN